MPIHSPRVGAFAAIVVSFVALPALAQVTASTLVVSAAAPQGYDPAFAFRLDGTQGTGRDEFGFRFTPSISGGLTSARAAIFASGSLGDGLIRMSVRADDNGRPGATVGQWTITPPRMVSGATPTPSASLDGSIIVQAGAAYWLIASGAPTGPLSWTWQEGGAHGTLPGAPNAYRARGQSQWMISDFPGNAAGGYELTVPAPGVLVAAGAGAMIAQRRRRGAITSHTNSHGSTLRVRCPDPLRLCHPATLPLR